MSDELVQAIRVNDLLIDSETGEILSEQNLGIDALCRLLKDGQEQEKAWAAANAAMKSAIGRKLEDAGVTKAETPWGVATWRTQVRRSASAANIDAVCQEHGLREAWRHLFLECATALDVKRLEQIGRDAPNGAVLQAVMDLIDEKTVSYVLLQPLRLAAPRVERVTVDPEAF